VAGAGVPDRTAFDVAFGKVWLFGELLPLRRRRLTSTTNYRARCTSLAEQWKTAEASNATHVSLGKAKADAAKGEKLCKSTKAADQKRGVADYEMALKLLGMTPS
jgi:hypothetical protein